MKIRNTLFLLSIVNLFPLFLHAQEKSFNPSDKRTTFWHAIHTKKTAVISTILGNDINEQNQKNWENDINDALLVIATQGLNDILVLILNNTITKKLIHSDNAYVALVCAINNKHYNAAEMLLNNETISTKFTAEDIQGIINIANEDWPTYLITLLNKILTDKSKN